MKQLSRVLLPQQQQEKELCSTALHSLQFDTHQCLLTRPQCSSVLAHTALKLWNHQSLKSSIFIIFLKQKKYACLVFFFLLLCLQVKAVLFNCRRQKQGLSAATGNQGTAVVISFQWLLATRNNVSLLEEHTNQCASFVKGEFDQNTCTNAAKPSETSLCS